MLYSLLTLLLPYWATPAELEFHTQFVLCAYGDYYEHLAATGFRDRTALTKVKKRTAYSMSILFWRKPELWRSIREFHRQVAGLRKSLLPLEDIPQFPVIYKHESLG